MKNKRTPEIRFVGFTDAWEQRKLGDLCNEFRSGEFIKASDISSLGEYPVYGGNGIRGYANKYNHDGEFALIGRQGALCGNMQYSCGKAYFTEHAVAVSANHENETRFLYYLFGKMNLGQYSGQSAQPGLAVGKLIELKTMVPVKAEQSKISVLFSKLDNLITLHQRELTTLKQTKQGFLQKMFPREGKTEPEVRFPGFSGAWEQRKLGEMLEERNEQMSENEEYPLMSFVQGIGVTPKGDRYDRSFLVKDDNKKYKKTELGDFIYSSNNLETGSIGFNKTGKAVISPVYSIFSSKSRLESQFIGILSTRRDFIGKMVQFRQGVVYGQWRIHEKDFLDIQIAVPSHDEQKEIIDFFVSLDHLITLHQRELDALKETKKAFLQKMFV